MFKRPVIFVAVLIVFSSTFFIPSLSHSQGFLGIVRAYQEGQQARQEEEMRELQLEQMRRQNEISQKNIEQQTVRTCLPPPPFRPLSSTDFMIGPPPSSWSEEQKMDYYGRTALYNELLAGIEQVNDSTVRNFLRDAFLRGLKKQDEWNKKRNALIDGSRKE